MPKKKLDNSQKVKEKVIKYDKLQEEEKKIDLQKSELKLDIEGFLKNNQRDLIDFDVGEDTYIIRASIYETTKLDYDVVKLMPILKKKNLLERISKTVIDPKALEDIYNQGLLSLEEIKPATSVKISKIFKVQRIKKRV